MTRYVLAPYFRCNVHNGKYYVGLGSKQAVIEEPERFEAIILVAKEFQEANTISKALNNCIDLTVSHKDYAIEFLKTRNLLIPTNRMDRDSFHSRQKLFYEYGGADGGAVLNRLQRSHVCILGAGGIGSHVAFELAGSGVRKLTVIDGDVIEDSNLTRQFLYQSKDLGKSKVETLQRELRLRFPNAQVTVIDSYVDKELSGVPECDLLFVAADKPRDLMQHVARYCIGRGLPYMNCGYLCDISVFGPLVVPGETGCTFCAKDIVAKPTSPEAREVKQSIEHLTSSIDRKFQTPSISSLNSISAGFATLDVIKFLGGFGEPLSKNRRLGYHSASDWIEVQSCERNLNCTECGHIGIIAP